MDALHAATTSSLFAEPSLVGSRPDLASDVRINGKRFARSKAPSLGLMQANEDQGGRDDAHLAPDQRARLVGFPFPDRHQDQCLRGVVACARRPRMPTNSVRSRGTEIFVTDPTRIRDDETHAPRRRAISDG
jgi:hypothetical protein